MLLLALQIKFERGLYIHNEGYDTDANYDLPEPLKKPACICVVTAAGETSLNLMGYQGSAIPTYMSTPTGRPAEPLICQIVNRCLNFDDSSPVSK